MLTMDRAQAEELVAHPSEGLNVELKNWLDPVKPDHRAKIARALLALRNRNGGWLLIGFDDSTLAAAPAAPADPRSDYHPDVIQGLVTKHASEPFQVSVDFVDRDGKSHPVFFVEPGVRTPVAVKSAIQDQSGKELLKFGEVPFRTLRANGTASTASAKPEDWPDIVEICFENREADVGRFIRRHLGATDFPGLVQSIASTMGGTAGISLRDDCEEFLAKCNSLFRQRINPKLPVMPAWQTLLDWGAAEVVLILSPELSGVEADEEFYKRLISSNPEFTKNPIWGDTRASTNPDDRPIQREGGWETLSAHVSSRLWEYMTFDRFDSTGKFYQRRLLEDDASARNRSAKPCVSLDPGIVIIKVAETMAVGAAFARALGCDINTTRLGFLFRWTGLQGRRLHTWVNPTMLIPTEYRCQDNEVKKYHGVPLDTPLQALAPHVKKITDPLFAAFNGYSISLGEIEQRLSNFFARRSR
jgi:hypothetical protein